MARKITESPLGRGGTQSAIRFLDIREGLLSVLEIETPGDQNVIRSAYQALLSMRAQVVRVDYQDGGPTTRYRLHVVELDGAPISAVRRVEIQSRMADLAGELLMDERTSVAATPTVLVV
jgi:hypothetical protein